MKDQGKGITGTGKGEREKVERKRGKGEKWENVKGRLERKLVLPLALFKISSYTGMHSVGVHGVGMRVGGVNGFKMLTVL